MRSLFPVVLLICCVSSAPAWAQNATSPGNVSSPHPTVQALSIEWTIDGDDNANGEVTVRYRPQGTGTWQTGLPLRRVPADSNQGFSWVNKHAGSVFDLQPGTTYEIELTLTDADGGSSTQTITAATRPVPVAPPGARLVTVMPGGFSAAAAAASPGDILLLQAGSYSGFTFMQDGAPGNPIIIRSATPGAAVINGDVRLDGRSDVWLEGVTVNGKVKFNNAFRLVVRGCTIHTTEGGIISYANGVEDAYICDNVVMGPATWALDQLGAQGFNGGEGIEVTGPGNVICYNYVQGFRDAISTMEDSEAHRQFSIDIYGNDINIATDDGIEADFTMGNVRVWGNRITNAFIGLSGQPTLGGPLYFIRNVQYNTFHIPFKLYRGSVGDVVLHNTVVKYGDALGLYPGVTWRRALFRNNLLIGGHSGTTYASTNGGYDTGDGDAADVSDAQLTGPDACSFDYDAFGAVGVAFGGRIGSATFSSLAELRNRTTEVHAQEVDMTVFASGAAFPDPPMPARQVPDLRLASGNAAQDNGVVLPNVNDGYNGAAPDLGAYEVGDTLPVYGPRTTVPGTDAGPAADGAVAPDAAVFTPDSGSATSGDGGTAAAADGGSSAEGNEDGGTGCQCSGGGTQGLGAMSLAAAAVALVLRRRRLHP